MIIEGKIINFDGESQGQVVIDQDSGLIEAIGENFGTADLQTDGLIFPGFVDVHVHAREDASGTQTYKENFRTMSNAAINGGIVHAADMPNNPVAPVDETRYREKQLLAEKSLVGITLYGGVGLETDPFSFPAPYKAFMGPSVGDLFFTSQDQLERVIARYARQAVSFHCEDPEILEAHKKAPTHEAKRPAEAEIKAVLFAIDLIERFKLNGKLCHLSTKAGLEAIVAAKQRGVQVTAEAAPHHLYFDETMLTTENRLWLQINPPLRKPEDRKALIAGLKNGALDYLATDHAPHLPAEKQRGISGMPHLDTYGNVAAWLMKEHNFQPQDIARVCAFNPGKFVNEFNEQKLGRIEKGYAGSFTIIDPHAPITIGKGGLKTKSAWSPFEGVTFPGRVTHTIVKGKIYEN